MSMKPVLENMAKGRRLAVRSIVLTALASMDCFVYRKVLLPVTDGGADRHEESWGGLGAVNTQDDHAFDYVQQGRAKLMLLDRFMGGRVFENNAAVDMQGVPTMALLEPYDPSLPKSSWPCRLTGWEFEIGDLVMARMGQAALLGFEVMDRTGSSAMADYGIKYVLNKRDELDYLEAFS